MRSKGKDVSSPAAGTDPPIGWSYAELEAAWHALYAEIPPPLGDGEKTLPMIARENGMDAKTARRYIERWIKEGKMAPVGKRRTQRGVVADAYIVIK